MIVNNDTICAPATPAGGAIGVVRVSGPHALEIVDKVFRGRKPLSQVAANTLHFGTVADAHGETVDQVVASMWRAPHSYTGEDCVELSCHGSRYIMQQLVQVLIDAGCRMADPGEYTQRAFLNGKMDLSQAEAVADLVAATNKATQRMALSQLRGGFSNELSSLREQLLKLTSLLELELDFSDHEELEFADRGQLRALAGDIDQRVQKLAQSFKTGQAIKQGIAVAIVGKTNVGKSTLLNQLLHEDRAIVSDVHGTTRDIIEDAVDINGVTFRFIDTAGLRRTDDQIERLGIERTYQTIDQATIVLWVVDAEPTPEECTQMLARCKDKTLILVRNKIDLSSPAAASPSSGSSSPSSGSASPSSGSASQFPEAVPPSPESSASPSSGSASQFSEAVPPSPESSASPSSGSASQFPEAVPPSPESSASQFSSLQGVRQIGISAKQGDHLDSLRQMIFDSADLPSIQENSVIVTSARHYDALQKAHHDLSSVMASLDAQLSGDLIAEDLHLVLDDLSDITGDGRINSQEVLHSIFSRFCIGK
jgi:tRNA modification GTPase